MPLNHIAPTKMILFGGAQVLHRCCVRPGEDSTPHWDSQRFRSCLVDWPVLSDVDATEPCGPRRTRNTATVVPSKWIQHNWVPLPQLRSPLPSFLQSCSLISSHFLVQVWENFSSGRAQRRKWGSGWRRRPVLVVRKLYHTLCLQCRLVMIRLLTRVLAGSLQIGFATNTGHS